MENVFDKNNSFVGYQSLIEFYGCNPSLIDDADFVKKTLLKVAEIVELTVVNCTIHHFSPIGVSGVVVIEESHIAVHTWPEYQYIALDFFTCNQQFNLEKGLSFLKKAFEANQIEQKNIKRGEMNKMHQFAQKTKN